MLRQNAWHQREDAHKRHFDKDPINLQFEKPAEAINYLRDVIAGLLEAGRA